jgi:NAD+ diphosphatase
MTNAAWLLVHSGGIVVRREGSGVELPTEADARALGVAEAGEGDAAHDVGALADGRPLRAVPVAGAAFPPPLTVLGLRDVFGILGAEVFMAAGTATQVVEWAATSRYCGRCATATLRVDGERCMRCPKCGLLAYPRIAPAVIVLVRRGNEALLARGARFPLPFYSTLAGFVEVGESLEQTVAREIREEVGVEVRDVRYFGSQPWPFPHSLMVGFTAEWAGGELQADGKEILDAGWYRASALPAVPPPVSIARRLIDAWVAEVNGKQ